MGSHKSSVDAIAIGCSAGGFRAMSHLLSHLPASFSTPILIVIHRSPQSSESIALTLDSGCPLCVEDASDKCAIRAGHIYFAPANYHILVERDLSISLSIDERIHFCRPSIDILFESAAKAYRNHLVGMILTGSNDDGSAGLQKIQEYGGTTIAQNPSNAEYSTMPSAAIKRCDVDHIMNLDEIVDFLVALA